MPRSVRGKLEQERLQLAPLPGTASSPASGPPPRDAAPSGAGQPLSSSVREYFEPRLGQDLGRVRIFTSASDARRARALNARAYTVGSAIVFGPGAYAPETSSGRWLLAHELVHVIQQQGAAPRVQKFEAGLHQAASLTAMTTARPGDRPGLTLEEANAAYFGNWMRDMNQVLVPMSTIFDAELVHALLDYMAAKKFGRTMTPEQFGYYIPAEHIDNPAGVVAEYDLLPGPRKSTTTPDPLFAKYQTPQDRTEPDAKVMGAGLFSSDQTGVMAHIRRTNLHVERRLELAVEKGRTLDGLMHFGAALHAVEDLFAHSNWVEIAVGTLLEHDPSLLPELKGENRKVFTFSPQVKTPAGFRPALTTGSFTSKDTQISISSELVTILRKPPSAPRTDAEARAQEYFVGQLLKQFEARLQNDQQLRARLSAVIKMVAPDVPDEFVMSSLSLPLKDIYEFLLMPHVPDWLQEVTGINAARRAISQGIYTSACLPLADMLEASVPVGEVSKTSLVENLEENKALLAGRTSSTVDPVDAIKELFGTPAETLKKEKLEQAKERVSTLEATPTAVVAGPSHSQIAKDHPSSPFFGLAFTLAVDADRRLKDRLFEAWEERHKGAAHKPVQFPAPPEEEGAQTLHQEHQHRVEKVLHRGQTIVAQGREFREEAYDIAAMRKETANRITSIADVLSAAATNPKQAGKMLQRLKNQLGIKKSDPLDKLIKMVDSTSTQLAVGMDRDFALELLALKLKALAVKIEAPGRSPSLEERARLHDELEKLQEEAGQVLLHRPTLDEGFKTMVLYILDSELDSTAVTYKPRQREILEGRQSIPGVSRKSLPVQTLALPSLQDKRLYLRALLQTSRDLITHPHERSKGGSWWRQIVRDFIRKHPKQLAAEIEARNKGYPLFRNPGTLGQGHHH
jgi:hypothetical protein